MLSTNCGRSNGGRKERDRGGAGGNGSQKRSNGAHGGNEKLKFFSVASVSSVAPFRDPLARPYSQARSVGSPLLERAPLSSPYQSGRIASSLKPPSVSPRDGAPHCMLL